MRYLILVLFFSYSHAADISKAVKSNNTLASNFYAQASKEEGNIFFSPISLSTALGVPYIGAEMETKKQMSDILHFDPDPEENSRSFGSLIQHLIVGPCTSEIEISNSLWIQENYPILPDFLGIAAGPMQAGVQSVDYTTETAKTLRRINSFVESSTNGQIKDLLQEGTLNTDTRAVIINTIYFSGAWQHFFEKTASEPFYLESGEVREVPMMHCTNNFLFKKFSDYSVLELPYQRERCGVVNLACYIILPDEGVALSEVEKIVQRKDPLSWGLGLESVAVSMPKFSLETTIDVKENLGMMGLTLPFSSQADFSGITGNKELFISGIIQKAKLNFDEKGSEASAATAVVMGIKCIPHFNDPVSFTANRPFFFMICDKTTHAILFMGRLKAPFH